MYLCGDLGGTKAQLALLDDAFAIQREQSYRSPDYDSLEAIIAEFMADDVTNVVAASFGVAGPIVNRRAHITNLRWEISADSISERFEFEQTYLLNDLEALATGIPYLKRETDLYTIHDKPSVPEASISVIAPGTGLGEAFLTWKEPHYVAYPSEGGHTSFAPTDDVGIGLLQFLLQRYEHVSVERVCSGMGIRNIYDYLMEVKPEKAAPHIAEKVTESDDPNPVITQAALDGECPICLETIQLFLKILAEEAGNIALTIYSLNGVYIGGGIPPRLLDLLDNETFVRHFTSKGRLSHILDDIPIYVILHPSAVMFGAISYLYNKRQ
jgi:glucokinase